MAIQPEYVPPPHLVAKWEQERIKNVERWRKREARDARHAETGRVAKGVTPQTPVSLWSRKLRKRRNRWMRHDREYVEDRQYGDNGRTIKKRASYDTWRCYHAACAKGQKNP